MRETEYEKLLLKAETTLGTVSIIFFLITVLLITVFIPSDSLLFWVVFISSLSLLFIAIAICLEAERVTGWYECGKCHNKYVPSRKAMILAPHIGRTRYLKCPECGKKSWNRKILSQQTAEL